MLRFLLVLTLVLIGCSRNSAPLGSSRTPSETLKQYYAAVTSSDTGKAYALSTTVRANSLKARAAAYFGMCYTQLDTIRIVREKPSSDSVCEVRYTDVAYDRTTGIKLDSELVECTMKRENGEWKVSQCHAPFDPFSPDTTIYDLNLGFEQANGMKPKGWYAGGDKAPKDINGYSAALDSKTVHGGKYSLHLKYVSGDGFGVATNSLRGLLPSVKGKTIRLTGWIKTEDVGDFAGLWWRVDGPNREMLAFNNMEDSIISGTQDWKRYSFELPVASNAINVSFGALLAGRGEAWFDDLSIDTNGMSWMR